MVSIARVKNILLRPEKEWRAIDREPGTIIQIFTDHVLPLATIGPAASLIGQTVFGIFGASHVPLGRALVSSLLSFAFFIIGVYVFAVVVNALAPRYGGRRDPVRATKLSAYSWTPAALGGVFSLVPNLSSLGIVATLYGLYLLYAGLPVIMKSPRKRVASYAAASAAVFLPAALFASFAG